MAAQWVDLRGARFYGISAADNLEPTEFSDPLHGPLTMGPFAPLGNVGQAVIAVGSPTVIDAHSHKIVRAIELTVEVTLSLYPSTEFVSGLGTVTQLWPSLQRVDVASAHFGPLSMGRPRERFNNVVRRNASDVPPNHESPGWTWDAPQQRPLPEPPLVDLVKGEAVPRAQHWTQRGTVSFDFNDTTLPMNFMGSSAPNLDQFGGAYVFFPPQYKYADPSGPTEHASTMDVTFTRLRVFVDDRPRWRAYYPTRVGTGLIAETPIEVTLSYPSGEPVIGETVRVTTSGARVQLAAGNSSRFRAYAESMSDGEGKVRFRVQGVEEGTAVVEITCGRTDLDGNRPFGQLYDPPLEGSVSIRVYGGEESSLPDEESTFPPPPYDPDAPPQPEEPPVVTPGETICTTYPEIDEIPAVPAWVETIVVNEWDAGANSVQELDGDVRTVFSFDAPVVGVAVGFVDHREDVHDYSRLMFGVLMSQSAAGTPQFRVMEYGRFRTGFIEYTLGEPIELRRVQNEFSAWYDGERLLRGSQAYDGTLIVGSSLYSTGDGL
jgi:hypothetical protein